MKVIIKATATVYYKKEVEMTNTEYKELILDMSDVGEDIAWDMIDLDVRSRDCTDFDCDDIQIYNCES
jgi:hypothetical protein